jgi:hypothetical protein
MKPLRVKVKLKSWKAAVTDSLFGDVSTPGMSFASFAAWYVCNVFE